VDGLRIERYPAKTSYIVGDLFDPAGLIVYAYIGAKEWVLENGEYTYTPNGPLTATDTKVTLSHKGGTIDVPITVNEPTKSMWIEAENCTIKNVGNGNGINHVNGSTYSFSSLRSKQSSGAGLDLCDKASNQDYLQDGYYGDTVTFTVERETAGTATFKMTASSNATRAGNGTKDKPQICQDVQVNKVWTITVNGVQIEIDDSVIVQGVEINGGSRDTWVYWRVVDLGKINLQAGVNTIVIGWTEATVSNDFEYYTAFGQNGTGHLDAFELIFD
jgi:hypothetical protein